ncbi:MAG: hypothetical protein GY906_07980 [bacterium]|nr:hypothetical protein [bacterium]
MRAAVVALALSLSVAGFAQEPTATVVSDTVVVEGLTSMLDAEEVSSRLTSGLTNTFVIEVAVRYGRRVATRGAARVDVRWELWDDEFLVSWIDLTGTINRLTATSLDELVAWWNGARFAVAPAPPRDSKAKPLVTITVGFLPFSNSESNAARSWLSQSMSGSSNDPEGPNEPGGGAEPGRVIDLVVATSIVSESIFEKRWTVPLIGGD